MMCEITNYSSREPIEYLLQDHIISFTDINLYEFVKTDAMKLMINGVWLGHVESPMRLVELFKSNRSKGIISIYASIELNIQDQSIFIYTDSGRCTCPLLKVQNDNLVINSYADRLIRWAGMIFK